MIRLTENDPWLKPYEARIQKRMEFTRIREKAITQGGEIALTEFAKGHFYYGLHRDDDGSWVIRDFLPGAERVYLVGSFNDWQHQGVYRLKRIDDYGDWELKLAPSALEHGDYYRLFVVWADGSGERLPAWSHRVVQDEKTGIFSAQVWEPKGAFEFKHEAPVLDKKDKLLIYECHVGMSSEEAKVNTYNDFRENVLPRVAKLGYNAIQLMAIQEHPYYGSFGYHVSNFFAPSSRFGTPEDLKALIDEAHGLGLLVIMDLVHSHAVKNEVEGLARYDGTRNLYFHEGARGEHPQWDSLCFDYGRCNVMQFLLSNCRYWLEEFNFDGYRFDGVSSMLYFNHGVGTTFTSYSDYFNGHQDADAMVYLTLANKLIHTLKPNAITIAEEVSGMPGLALPIEDGGFGFDYRLAMNIPDYWTKLAKDLPDEAWRVGSIWYELTNRRRDELTISYAESHDQALVGDKTLMFRLADANMYWHMARKDRNLEIDRAIALHKMIRLATATTMIGGYLNFMGNEFGHPEWIDFPRLENGWSHNYARRQWSLADNKDLLYHDLQAFDEAMLSFVKKEKSAMSDELRQYYLHEDDQVLAYGRGDKVFIFNFAPTTSYTDYTVYMPKGDYKVVLDTDEERFGGYGLNDLSIKHSSAPDCQCEGSDLCPVKLYLPARTAMILQRER